MILSCGCEMDGSARCQIHLLMECHTADWRGARNPGECPPCRIAKWRSVSLSSAATPTRRGKLL